MSLLGEHVGRRRLTIFLRSCTLATYGLRAVLRSSLRFARLLRGNRRIYSRQEDNFLFIKVKLRGTREVKGMKQSARGIYANFRSSWI